MTVHVDASHPLYQAIIAHVLATGQMPAIEDMLAGLPYVMSRSTGHYHLRLLLEAGLLEQPRRYHGYKLPDPIMIELLKQRMEQGT